MRLPLLGALVLLLLPTAAADHAFSHRVWVEGRVVDARGLPVPGVTPQVEIDGSGACDVEHQPTTGPTGDFSACRHLHDILPGAEAVVRLGELEEHVAIDPDLRRAIIRMRLSEPSPTHDVAGERRFNRTLHVEGRVFSLYGAPRDVDGVAVFATPRSRAPVEVRLLGEGRLLAMANATTSVDGGYEADLEAYDLPPDAAVQVLSEGQMATRPADPVWRRADADLIHDLRVAPTPLERPGTSTPRVPGFGLGALVTAAVLMAAARRLAGGGR